jgi:hypothetical protein
MAGLVRKNFDFPDEVRPFEEGKGKLQRLSQALLHVQPCRSVARQPPFLR